MSNSVKFTIDSPDGSHTVFLEQDAKTKTTIHSNFEGSKHDMTEMSCNADGTAAKGDIWLGFWKDPFTLLFDPEAFTGTMMISGLNRTYSGVVAEAEMTKAMAFLKKCGLPRLSE